MKRSNKWVMVLTAVCLALVISTSTVFAGYIDGVRFTVKNLSGQYIGFQITIDGKQNIAALKACPWAPASVAATAAIEAESFYTSFYALGLLPGAPVITTVALSAKIGSLILSKLRYCKTQLVITAKNTRLSGNKKLFSPSIQWFVSYR